MKELPICIFTKNRTSCATATVEALIKNLKCNTRQFRYILCDDMSKNGHVDAILSVFHKNNIEPTVFINTVDRHGLGASMNNGITEALNHSDEFLRLEDDWLLKKPLDISDYAENMSELSIGSIRLGMMFRSSHELIPFTKDLYRVRSDIKKIYTFNNQIALCSKTVYELCGKYVENVSPEKVERDMAEKYNRVSSNCKMPPWVCWPNGWATNKYYDQTLPFAHIGVSTLGHNYNIPSMYMYLNSPKRDEELREKAINKL